MKKIILASLFVLALGTFAFAQQGGGMGKGMGGGMGTDNNNNSPCPAGNCNGNGRGHGGGYGYGHGPKHGGGGYGPNCMQGGNYVQPEATVKTADEAKAKVQEVLKSDFKGYKITKTEEFIGRNGNKSFRVLTSDAGGNEFIFHVNPFGNVNGPWLSKNTPK